MLDIPEKQTLPIITRHEAFEAIKGLKDFMSLRQLRVMVDGMRDEEKEFFLAKAIELGERVKNMPEPYGQREEKDPIVYLHYFRGSTDFWITERDNVPGEQQFQAYGYANLGSDWDAEWGYISIQELIECNVELDWHWTPKPFSQCKTKRGS